MESRVTGEKQDLNGDLDVGTIHKMPDHAHIGESDKRFFHDEKTNADGGEPFDAEFLRPRWLFFHLRRGRRASSAEFLHEPDQTTDEFEDQQKRRPADQQQVEIDQPPDARTRIGIPDRPPIIRRLDIPDHNILFRFILFRHSRFIVKLELVRFVIL